MRLNSFVKIAAPLALAAAAVSAQALTLSVSGAGSYTINSSFTVATFDEDVVYQKTSPLAGKFDTVEYTFTSAGTGTAVYKNAADTQELDLALTYNPGSYTLNSQFQAATATWTYSGGKGDYVAASGYGTFTFNVDTDDQSSLSTLKGQLTPVPEPASFAVVGVGLVGLVARRRRK